MVVGNLALTLVGVFGVSYYFRRFIVRKVFWMSIFFLKYMITFYSFMKRSKNKMYRLEYKKLDDYVMDKYHLIENDKTHTVVFMSNCNNALYKHIIDFKKDITSGLENKNLIVHCSISDDDNNIIMDLTELFRRFCHYYDKDYTLHGFFKYIEEHKREFKKNMSHVNIYDYNLIVYLNDNLFTEVSYPIRVILNENIKFSELLQIVEAGKKHKSHFD